LHWERGGLMLMRSSPDWAVRVCDVAAWPAGDIILCSWARPFTLTVSLTAQVYKWVPVNLMLGVTRVRWTSIPRYRDKLSQDSFRMRGLRNYVYSAMHIQIKHCRVPLENTLTTDRQTDRQTIDTQTDRQPLFSTITLIGEAGGD